MGKKTAVSGAVYHLIGDAVNKFPGTLDERIAIADHFAHYFHGRSPSFDPQAWYQKTGGLVNGRPKLKVS